MEENITTTTTTETGVEENIEENAEQNTEGRLYSEEEVKDMLQREADRRVSQALKKQQAKFEKEQSEAEKLRNMDEAQRKDYEFEKKMAEFEKERADFEIMRNKVEASKIMAERGLPISFVDYIVAQEADTMLDNINKFETEFKSAVQDAVSAKVKTGSPKSGSAKQTGMTREEFSKLSVAQKTEIFNTNPNLYKAMVGR